VYLALIPRVDNLDALLCHRCLPSRATAGSKKGRKAAGSQLPGLLRTRTPSDPFHTSAVCSLSQLPVSEQIANRVMV
jgi:hypothetical protein